MKFDVLKKIGYILRFNRRAKKLSQHQMAETLGISARNYQRIESGEVEPKLETLAQIAQVLEIPVSSLIRNTDRAELSIFDLSSYRERVIFQDLTQTTQSKNEDLQLVEQLIEKDRWVLPGKEFEAHMNGTQVTLSDKLSKYCGLSSSPINIQNYVMLGTPVERWEYIFRHGLKSAVIENPYLFPKGIVVMQSYHHSLNPNPDNPTSDMYLRDITERHNLESWLKTFKNSKALI